jgi:hypothetical protein
MIRSGLSGEAIGVTLETIVGAPDALPNDRQGSN